MSSNTTAPVAESTGHPGDPSALCFGFMIAWSALEPHRVGEVALLGEEERATVGRGADPSDPPKLAFVRQRPGELEATPPLGDIGISRDQLEVRARSFGLLVKVVGKCPTRFNGEAVAETILVEGDTVLFREQMLLLVVRRPRLLPAAQRFAREHWGPFGEPNAFGLVGESPSLWALLEETAGVAASNRHTLLRGASGTGKELVARALHLLSKRASGPFVARDASTIPQSIAAAELYGNGKGFPNVGQLERPGLIGAADGGTLFLDEIGELPHDLQALLLRALDAGYYQRLGEVITRQSTFVLVGATNRENDDALKHDVRRRFTREIRMPTLDARREDIPLLVRHNVLRAADKGDAIAAEWVVESADGRRDTSVPSRVIDELLRRKYPGNVRELDEALWRALDADARRRAGVSVPPPAGDASDAAAAKERAHVEECLRREGGNVSAVARVLGMHRNALIRLMKKHGIARETE